MIDAVSFGSRKGAVVSVRKSINCKVTARQSQHVFEPGGVVCQKMFHKGGRLSSDGRGLELCIVIRQS